MLAPSLILLATLADAGEATLTIVHPASARVTLDGEPLIAVPLEPTRSIAYASAGEHALDLHDANGRRLVGAEVLLPQGFEVSCVATDRALTCPTARQTAAGAALPKRWGLQRSPTLVVHSDGTPVDLWLDGALALSLRGASLALVHVTPGVHSLDLREPGGDSGWAAGTFDTRSLETITIRFDQARIGRFDPPTRWRSGGGAGVPTLGPPARATITTTPFPAADLSRPSIDSTLSDPWSDGDEPKQVPTSVDLVLQVASRSWCDVAIDGVIAAEFRGSGERKVSLLPGRHTVEIRPFLEDSPSFTGIIDTGTEGEVTLQIDGSHQATSEPLHCLRPSDVGPPPARAIGH